MPYNGSGTFTPYTPGNPVIPGTVISSTAFNATQSDLAAGLTNAITRDGQSPPTANLPMGGRKLTGLGAGITTGDTLRWEQLFSQGTEQDIASAATTDIGALNTTVLRITATTTITSLGTNYNGPRYVRFGGILTLTHNATTLILPTNANITTAAGDSAIFVPKGNPADGWECASYQRANGTALVASGVTPGSITSSGLTMATSRILGRVTASTGAIEELTGAAAQTLLPVQQTRVDIASTGTVNLTTGAPNTDHINITGTSTISAFTVAAGRMLFLRFSGSLTLASGAAITTQTGADIVTQNGDTCIIRALSANVVEVLCYREGRWGRQDGTAPFYACRGFLYYNGSTNAILSSGNCSSVTDNGGNGDYTYNFTTAMPSANYAVATGGRITSPGYSSVQEDAATAKTSSAFRFSSVAQSGGVPIAVDCTGISLIIFG